MNKYVLFLWVFISILTRQTCAQTVYITKSDENYHVSGCHHLGKSKIALDLKEALAQDCTACKHCRPAQDENKLTEKQLEEKPDPETTITTATRCSAATEKKSRCKNITHNVNGKCWQHGG